MMREALLAPGVVRMFLLHYMERRPLPSNCPLYVETKDQPNVISKVGNAAAGGRTPVYTILGFY